MGARYVGLRHALADLCNCVREYVHAGMEIIQWEGYAVVAAASD